jgi:hypothetical protein
MFSLKFLLVPILLRGVHVLDQAESVGPLRTPKFNNVHALFNKMESQSAWLYFFKFSHAELRPLDGRSSITHQDLETFGRFAVGLSLDRAEEHFNWLVGPALVRMPDNICQRFIDCASYRAAIWRSKSEVFRQSFHGAAHRTQQTGVTGQLQLQQQAAVRVPVPLPPFASPHWMKEFHVKLNFALGFGSPVEPIPILDSPRSSLRKRCKKFHQHFSETEELRLPCLALRKRQNSARNSKTRGIPLPTATGKSCGKCGSSGLG